ncbi:MAG: CDP-diacylglycerol--glycerol-3-phosphate 3-phosphatidyltransferase [Clostridia bacterium]|nr:CDP-diacylglycerol--glycerol-3-phosphate 3-phosphatidyltransferase [Clostridia bacterium]
MNIPNQLTILRVLLVPVFMACILYIPDPVVCGIVSAAVFALTSLTDMLDGKIARKYNLVTNFGKFMDPLADKFMVFAALLTITVKCEGVLGQVMVWASAIVFLRELGVTSIRLVCANTEAGVIAASWFGKCKTVTQIAAIIVLLLEPVFCILTGIDTMNIASYILVGLMIIMTVGSGIDYLKGYWKYITPNK